MEATSSLISEWTTSDTSGTKLRAPAKASAFEQSVLSVSHIIVEDVGDFTFDDWQQP